MLGPPLAVGQMAVSGESLDRADDVNTKGKAVYVLHTWKDQLWELGPGKKMDVPEPCDPAMSLIQDESAVAGTDTSSSDGLNQTAASAEIPSQPAVGDSLQSEASPVEADRATADALTPEGET